MTHFTAQLEDFTTALLFLNTGCVSPTKKERDIRISWNSQPNMIAVRFLKIWVGSRCEDLHISLVIWSITHPSYVSIQKCPKFDKNNPKKSAGDFRSLLENPSHIM